jgi:hypothetical protein
MAGHPSCDRTVWRAAIALNNIGWTLLERACYDQAHLTLKDAARAMVALVHDGSRAETRQTIESCLHAASQRLAFPHRSLSQSLPDRELELRPLPLHLDVDELGCDPSLESLAIAVHNSAVSYYYVSVSADHAPEAQRSLLATAVSLLRSSYSIISEVCGSAPATFAHALPILENLRNLTRLFMRTGDASTAPGGRLGAHETLALWLFELDVELDRLRMLILALESIDRSLFGHSVFAAAA